MESCSAEYLWYATINKYVLFCVQPCGFSVEGSVSGGVLIHRGAGERGGVDGDR